MHHGQQSDITQKEMTAMPQSTGNYQSMAVNDSATIDDLAGNLDSKDAQLIPFCGKILVPGPN